MKVANYLPFKILTILGIVALGWHLLSIFGSFLNLFTDLFVLLFLSWVLAFVLDPVVNKISRTGIGRIGSAVVTYIILTVSLVAFIFAVLPTTVSQIGQLTSLLPEYLPENFLLAPQVVNFLTATAANSVILASGIAGALTNTLLIFIISFYLLISRREISQFILKIIPDEYEDDYLFLEKTLNQTFGSFLQVQVFLGLVLGIITFAVLVILQINFALSSALVAAVLAMVPVIGPILFLLPVILAGLTVSLQKMIIAVVVIALAAQLVYNFLAPKLLGSALKIHPLIVLLSFLLGYRLTGVWGAIFAVPIVSAVAIISQELLKYWKQEADK